MPSRHVRRSLLVPMLIAIFLAAGVSAKEPKTPSLEKQIEFGVKMAKRGLWNEALFRFQQASYQRPDDPRILNNMAVAYEATGQYDRALESYQKALRAAPSNRDLRANYARFVEFYQSFKPDQSAEDLEAAKAEAEAAAQEDPAAADAEETADSGPPGDG